MTKTRLKDYMSEQGWTSLQREKGTQLVEKVLSTSQIEKRKYFQFQDKYRLDPSGFVRDCIDWEQAKGDGPTDYQQQILDDWDNYHRQAIRGPRGLGKSAMAAWTVLHYALTHDGEDWKVITTASYWAQLEDFLWPEIHKWGRLLQWDMIGREPFRDRYELRNTKLKLETGSATARSPEKPEAIEGGHADYMCFVYDEAKIIPDELWNSVEGTFSNVGGGRGSISARVIAISTPGEPVGRFFDIHSRKRGYEDWHVTHITKDNAIAAGMMNAEWAEQKKRQWGENSQMYHNHVLGEFKESERDTLIPLAWIETAQARWDQWQKDIKQGTPRGQMTSVGVDVGGGGDDNCVIAPCFDGRGIDQIQVFSGHGDTVTMEVAGRVKGLIDANGCDAYIDTIGVGLGVYNRLKEQGHKEAIAFVASQKTPLKDKTKQYKFRDKRSAMWWLGREMFDPQNDTGVMIPRDEKGRIAGELTTPKYEVKSNATVHVQTKKEIRQKLKRSTDLGDGILQALVGPKLCKKATARVYVPGQGYIDD